MTAWITLDPVELERAKVVARRVAARYAAGRDEAGAPARMKYDRGPRTFYEIQEAGFGGELAVSIHTGLPWNEGKRGRADVGENVDVRQTAAAGGVLPLYPWDKLARVFVLAIGSFPSYELVGWLVGTNGITLGEWMPVGSYHRGYRIDKERWNVPQSALRPMDELTVRA